MKSISRLLSIIIIMMMTATPFMSFATEEGSFDASGNDSEVTAAGDDDDGTGLTETGKEAEDTSADVTDTAANDSETSETDASTNVSDDNQDKTDGTGTKDGSAEDPENKEKLPDEPTEVTVVDSVEELSEESEAAYDNEAFFTIDAANDDSADLATEEVSSDVTDILSGDGSASEKQSDIVDTLEDSGLYHAEGSGENEVDVTSKFAYQRLRLIAPQEAEINAYGAAKAVYFEGSYQLSYDSIEATMQAYDALVSEYGKDSVLIDMPLKLSAGEKGWGTAYMKMDYQKTLKQNSGPVTVAVIDSGIQKTHPVFSGRTILAGRDFINNDNDPADDNGHGTEVSGVIAESAPPNVKILPVKAMDSKGEGTLLDILSAVNYAEKQNADIINISIGGYLDYAEDMETCDEIFGKYDALIVCAAGNENQNMDASGVYEFPGELRSTVCVASITAGKTRSSFSNYGKSMDFAAPGSSILLAKRGGSYGYDSGTSFSSPYVAAAAATVKAGHTGYSKTQLFNYLKSISEDMGSAGKDVYFGNGCPIFPREPDQNIGNSTASYNTDKTPGWHKIDGEWYYYKPNGQMAVSAWARDSKEWCYLGPDGRMFRNRWARDSKDWCYVGSDGRMFRNRWARDSKDWCYVGSDGRLFRNRWAKDSKGWCWLGSDGRLVRNEWIVNDEGRYYVNSDGYRVTGTQKIGGKTYRFDSSGKWIS